LYTFLKSIFLLAAVVIGFSGCLKKGEDDPLISLRTRNARVVGEWKVEKGFEYESVRSLSSYSVYNASYNESTYDIKYETGNNSNSSIAQSGFFNYSIKFDSDGGFTSEKYTENSEPRLREIIGRWNFTNSVGKNKNKEEILITVSSIKETFISGTDKTVEYTGNKKNYVYELRELRNKRMVISRSLSEYSDPLETYFNSSFTLKQ